MMIGGRQVYHSPRGGALSAELRLHVAGFALLFTVMIVLLDGTVSFCLKIDSFPEVSYVVVELA